MRTPFGGNFEVVGSPHRNPHVSWHGSGTVHAKAINSDTGLEEKISDGLPSLAWNDVRIEYTPVLGALVPAKPKNLLSVDINPDNAVRLMDMGKAMPSGRPDTIILNGPDFMGRAILIDIYIHNAGMQFSWDRIGQGREFIGPAAPIVFNSPDSIFAPGVTVLIHSDSELDSVNADLSCILRARTTDKTIKDIFVPCELRL